MNNKLTPGQSGDHGSENTDADGDGYDNTAQSQDDFATDDADFNDWGQEAEFDREEDDGEESAQEFADHADEYEGDGFSPGYISRPAEHAGEALTETDFAPELPLAEENPLAEDDWQDSEDLDDDLWLEEDEDSELDQPEGNPWPLGLVAVAIIALLLLGVGGYGVMQQRSDMQDEITQLRATLATTVEPAEAAQARGAVNELQQRIDEQQATIEELQLEARGMRDTITGLEAQLIAQQQAMGRPASEPEARPEPNKQPMPQAASQPAVAKPAPAATVSATGGDWFVNFGSYSQRSAAQSWAARLHPASGTVIIASGSRNGETFYRVRIVELADKAEATGIARQLEREFNLEKLWIGRQ